MVLKVWIVLVVSFACFSWFVYTHGDDNNKEGTPNQQVLAGWKVWQDNNCQSCHQLYGLGGYMGPDLTNVATQTGKGPSYMEPYIKYGTGRMPSFHLSDTDVHDLIGFLKWVDKSGQSKLSEGMNQQSGSF